MILIKTGKELVSEYSSSYTKSIVDKFEEYHFEDHYWRLVNFEVKFVVHFCYKDAGHGTRVTEGNDKCSTCGKSVPDMVMLRLKL